jgi:hypothetical protein
MFTGHLTAGIALTADSEPTKLDLRNVTVDANEFWMADNCHVDSFILWDGLTIRRKDQLGELRPEWNASVS